MWDVIVSVPDHCVSFYFAFLYSFKSSQTFLKNTNFHSPSMGCGRHFKYSQSTTTGTNLFFNKICRKIVCFEMLSSRYKERILA